MKRFIGAAVAAVLVLGPGILVRAADDSTPKAVLDSDARSS